MSRRSSETAQQYDAGRQVLHALKAQLSQCQHAKDGMFSPCLAMRAALQCSTELVVVQSSNTDTDCYYVAQARARANRGIWHGGQQTQWVQQKRVLMLAGMAAQLHARATRRTFHDFPRRNLFRHRDVLLQY